MTQITERLMLITLGISLIGLFFPYVNPIIDYLRIGAVNQEILDSDIRDLKRKIDNFDMKIDDENYTGNFNYNGEISIIIAKNDSKSNILYLRFCNLTKNELEFRILFIPISFRILILSLFVTKYHIFQEDNKLFIIFE